MNIFLGACLSLGILVDPSFEASIVPDDYNALRQRLLQEEYQKSLGGNLVLTEEEENANKVLMHWKHKELNEAFDNPKVFNFSKHYFVYKDDIPKSKVYKIIRKMPKGAALHIHSSMMLDPDNLLTFTYEDNLYACAENGTYRLQFSDIPPKRACLSNWTLLSELRNTSGNVNDFDRELRKQFTLYTELLEEQNFDINYTWERFNSVYRSIKSLTSYRPVREKYFYAALKNFYEDNIMYIEIRSGLSRIYELNGTVHKPLYLAELYDKVTKEFIKEHPDFIGIKFISTKNRKGSVEEIKQTLNLARQMKKEYPGMYAGFDLVGQEDLGKPLIDLLPTLMDEGKDLKFYFHGGESNWYGMSTDENLFDAVLLGTKRLGHGYALTKHPTMVKSVLERKIALEVNIVSNVVLSLVRDVRNHPLATFLALGLPVVLSSDDPGAWEADPLSHDFYIAFVGVASKHADLRLLKQLALNSIEYSALDDASKAIAMNKFNTKWQIFIKELANESINPQVKSEST